MEEAGLDHYTRPLYRAHFFSLLLLLCLPGRPEYLELVESVFSSSCLSLCFFVSFVDEVWKRARRSEQSRRGGRLARARRWLPKMAQAQAPTLAPKQGNPLFSFSNMIRIALFLFYMSAKESKDGWQTTLEAGANVALLVIAKYGTVTLTGRRACGALLARSVLPHRVALADIDNSNLFRPACVCSAMRNRRCLVCVCVCVCARKT